MYYITQPPTGSMFDNKHLTHLPSSRLVVTMKLLQKISLRFIFLETKFCNIYTFYIEHVNLLMVYGLRRDMQIAGKT